MAGRIQNLVLQNIRLKEKLLPLQFAVLEKVRHNGYAFVFDEVGCGKTIESGIVIWDSIVNGGNKILVVCPSNLVFNWYNELLVKFGLDFKIIHGTKESIDLYSRDISHLNEIANLCIVTYDSRSHADSNAALDRLKCHNIKWDLIVLDEGHGSKNEASQRYRALEQFDAKKVLFLSATPIKTASGNFNQECSLVQALLRNEKIDVSLNDRNVEPLRAVAFSRIYPISRNFKEIMLDKQEFRNRKIEPINYSIHDTTVGSIETSYFGIELERKLGCIFNYSRAIMGQAVYKTFLKNTYKPDDLERIRQFDDKLNKLLVETGKILQSDDRNKVVIFANHRLVIDYLQKALVCHFGEEQVEAMHGETYLPDERRNRIALLDNVRSELGSKRILVISHQIGVVGINMSRFNHLINYELPDTPADLEQRFGRIDRVTNLEDFNELTMYYFIDTNRKFDTVYVYRLFNRFSEEVIPLLPSKNLLYSSSSYIEWFTSLIQLYIRITENKQFTEEDKEKYFVLMKTREFPGIEKVEDMLKKILQLIEFRDGDELKSKIELFADKGNREVVYGIDNQSLSYGQLKAMVFTKEYTEFADSIALYEHDIEALRREIINCHSLEDVLVFIRRRIEQDHVRDELVFAIVYNVWKIWNGTNEREEKVSLKSFFECFNKGALR